ncbi:Disease resistance protein RPM1 [Linum grandiflorum]
MAEGSISFSIIKLTEFMDKEGRLLLGVHSEAEYINDELEFMKAFLRVADTMEEYDEALKVLVNKVRAIAFEMEDALDDFKLRVVNDYGRGHYASIQFLKARHQIASKMRRIKSRVVTVSEAHRRYLNKNNIMEQCSSSSSEMHLARRGDALLLEDADLVGIENPKRQLIRWLVGGKSEREMVSITGMGGLGKTTLAKKVYDDADVKKHFKFCVWITLSPHLMIDDVLKDMIQRLFLILGKPKPRGLGKMDHNKLRAVISQFLQKRRYLIVLDDVWHAHSWEALEPALPNNRFGSRVLLTTRNTEVASTLCMDSPDKVYELEPLSAEESWTLFCKKTFRIRTCPPHLKIISEKILHKCEGLPLAIVAISGVLATKDHCRIDEWEMVHRSIAAELEDNNKLRSATRILSLSYSDLPFNLKSCLLYFSIFPPGTPVNNRRLIRLFIAEGFVKEKEGMALEEVAEDYLQELRKRSLLQAVKVSTDGRVKSCRIHDLLREIIVLKSREQDFAAVVKEEKLQVLEKVRRVSIQNVTPDIRRVLRVGSQLRSLLMFWGPDSSSTFSLPALSSSRLRLLNVLDMEGAPLEEFPTQISGLRLLKYLSLRHTMVHRIPSSIGKLQNLETLDLKHTKVTELPNEIVKLKKISHLLVYSYEMEADSFIKAKSGFKAPSHIGSLQSLHRLSLLDAKDCDETLMSELGKLTQLRRLGILNLKKSDGKMLCSSIEKMVNLRALSVNSDNSEVIDMEFLTSPPLLQRLYLAGCLTKLPEWISSLDSLVTLVLKWSRLQDDPSPSLQHLPNLLHLELIQVYDGEAMCFQAGGFPRLKLLALNKLERLKTITVEKGAMPCLKKLVVQSCKSLERVPQGIRHLSKLKVLEFFDMPRDLVMLLHPSKEVATSHHQVRCRRRLWNMLCFQRILVSCYELLKKVVPLLGYGDTLEVEDDDDYHQVQHIPEVYCTYQTEGIWDVYRVDSIRKGNCCEESTDVMRDYEWKL